MGMGRFMYVSASVTLTLTFIAVGISFFGPFWLSNLGNLPTTGSTVASTNDTRNSDNPDNLESKPYLPGGKANDERLYPDRGLWAQCGQQCVWFWTDDYRMQKELLTPTKWHLATQIIYFIGAAIILFAEFFARVQMCCHKTGSKKIYAALAIMIFVSVLLQTAALATFGGGASTDYEVVTDPKKIKELLDDSFSHRTTNSPYLGWCYWLGVAGDFLSVITGVLFMLAACCANKE